MVRAGGAGRGVVLEVFLAPAGRGVPLECDAGMPGGRPETGCTGETEAMRRFLSVILAWGVSFPVVAVIGNVSWAGTIEEDAPRLGAGEGAVAPRQPDKASEITPPVKAPPAEPGKKPEGREAAPAPKSVRMLTADQVVSEKALIYINIRNVRQALKSFSQTAFASLLREEEIEGQISAAAEKFKRAYTRGDGTLPEAMERRRQDEVELIGKAAKCVDREICVAAEADPSAGGGLNWMVVVSTEDPDRLQDILDLLERFRTSQLMDPNNIDDDFMHGDYSVHSLENRERKTYEAWAQVENLLIYARGRGMVEAAIDRYRKQGAGALATSAAYTLPFRQVGREADAYIQITAGGIRALRKLVSEENILAALASTGVGETTPAGEVALAAGIGFASGGSEGKGTVREHILVRRFVGEEQAGADNVEGIVAKLVPADALYFEACRTKLSDMVPAFAATKPGEASPGPVEMARSSLATPVPILSRMAGWHMLKLLREGANIQDRATLKRLMEPFKGEIGAALTYIPGNPAERAIEQIHFFELDAANREGILDAMRNLTEGSGTAWRTRTAENLVITHVVGAGEEDAIGEPPGARIGLFGDLLKNAAAKKQEVKPSAPAAQPAPQRICFFSAWTIIDVDKRRFLVASDSVRAVQKAIQQVKLAKSSLAAQPEFQKVLASFPDSRVQVTYVDLPRLAEFLYQFVIPGLEGVKFELPPVDVLARHLSPMGISTSAAEKGMLVAFRSPTGLIPLAGAVGGMAYPVIQRERARQISARVAANMRRIALGLHLYASDFDRFPQALSDLYPKYISDIKVFESPLKPGAVRTAVDIDDPEKSNLKYIPGRGIQDMSEEILLYEVSPTGFRVDIAGEMIPGCHYVQLDCRVDVKPKAFIERRLAGLFEATVKSGGAPGEASPSRPAPARPQPRRK
ncbi:MAG: DUF3352 domain-containing protein [Planctomycetota bacterium]|nr:DUF3352 domain-containing protein [Planctomycetota bacterium]